MRRSSRMSRETVSQTLQLKWNEYESNIRDAFFNLKEKKDFSDVTLVCRDGQIEAHKVILSACSPFFQRVLTQNSHTHPLIYLKGVKFTDLESILQFMYLGKVDVVSANIVTLLDVAQELEVKGLIKDKQFPGPPTTAPVALGAPSNVLQHPVNVLQATSDVFQPLPSSTLRLSCQVAGRELPLEEDFSDDKGSIRLKPWSELAQPRLSLQTPTAEDHKQYGQYRQYRLHDQDEQLGEEGEYEEEEKCEDNEENGGNVSEAVDGNQNLKEAEEKRKAYCQQYIARVDGNKFMCNVAGCGKKFSRDYHAENHAENSHFPGIFLYRCSKCHQDFNSWRSLYNHGRSEHSVNWNKMDRLQAMK